MMMSKGEVERFDIVTKSIPSAGGVISIYSLTNGTVDVEICSYGATIMVIKVPDKDGVKSNVVAGFKDPLDYYKDHPYFGSTVGRFANRIAFGKFSIDGQEYSLPVNNDVNHLHGGINGFSRKNWNTEKVIKEDNKAGVTLSYTSEDGEENYPGKLTTYVSFVLSEDNKLIISYKAKTTKSTIINLTNHSYFNLSGFEQPTIKEHLLQVNADCYTEKNEHNVPNGKINPVAGTGYDFTNSKAIGKDIDQFTNDNGYDINYVLTNIGNNPAAALYDPQSGRRLKVYTDQPGMQVYTANFWDGTIKGLHDKYYEKHGAVALETQAFPNAPNHPNFPNSILRPGETYNTETIFQFETDSVEQIKNPNQNLRTVWS